MQHQLGHKGKQCTKASTKVWWCDWHITSWHHLLQLVQNANMDLLFWSYNGAALSDTKTGKLLMFKQPFVCN
jgi:hypothetical protein